MNSIRSCLQLFLRNQNIVYSNYTALRHFRRSFRPILTELVRRKKKYNTIQPPVIRSNFLEWNRDAELYAFNSRLSERFDLKLLEQALTHRSYVEKEEAKRKELEIGDPKLHIADNTDMVKEGKTLLPKIIQNYLSSALPFAPKECIIAIVNYLLSTDNLAHVSSGIGTKDLILCSTHPTPNIILAETFYALVTALKNSVDLIHASIFVRDILIAALAEKDLTEIWCPEEPLKVLNDILLREQREFAEPRLVAESGVNTLLAVYQVAVYSNKQFLGIGIGNTVEEAKNMAALNSLLRIFRLMDNNQPFKCNLKVSDSLDQPIQNMSLSEWSSSKIGT